MLALIKNKFIQATITVTVWLAGSFLFIQPCIAQKLVMNARGMLIHNEPASEHYLMPDKNTVYTSPHYQGLFQYDTTGNNPVNLQFETSQPVWLGLKREATTLFISVSNEETLAIINQLQSGTQQQKEIQEKASEPPLILPLLPDPPVTPEEEQSKDNQAYHSTSDDNTMCFLISSESEEDNQDDSVAIKHDFENKEDRILRDKDPLFYQKVTGTVVFGPPEPVNPDKNSNSCDINYTNKHSEQTSDDHDSSEGGSNQENSEILIAGQQLISSNTPALSVTLEIDQSKDYQVVPHQYLQLEVAYHCEVATSQEEQTRSNEPPTSVDVGDTGESLAARDRSEDNFNQKKKDLTTSNKIITKKKKRSLLKKQIFLLTLQIRAGRLDNELQMAIRNNKLKR